MRPRLSRTLPASLYLIVFLVTMWFTTEPVAQTLLNVDFGGDETRAKTGLAATGLRTNDYWNVYSHYQPRYLPGMAPAPDGRLTELKWADGTKSGISVSVTNAPGVWGNATGDPMLDSYMFAPNGSNLVVAVRGLPTGRYQLFVYGWATADAGPEQLPMFSVRSGTNVLGPVAMTREQPEGAGWRVRAPYAVYRDLPVESESGITIEVLPGSGGVAVLNGLQVLSRGTHAPRVFREPPGVGSPATNLWIRGIHYQGTLETEGARFKVSVDAESSATNEVSAVLLDGHLAVVNPQLPAGWRMVKQGRRILLLATRPGRTAITFEAVVRSEREEPWNVVRFGGPSAAVATVEIEIPDREVEVQLLSGVAREGQEGDGAVLRGVLGGDRQLAIRWQGKTAEAEREALLTVDSRFRLELTPASIRYTSTFAYEILQARLAEVRVALPAAHTLTRLTGEQVKDWRLVPGENGSELVVEFLRPIEGSAQIEMVSEQAPVALPGTVELRLPQPLAVQREAGVLSLHSEDLLVRLERTDTLRQVNATGNEFASFRFARRPAGLAVHLASVEPQLAVNSRVRFGLEEARAVVDHDLTLEVTRAGIYGLDLMPEPGFLVTDVRAEGLEDWQSSGGPLRLRFARRVLGQCQVKVRLERSLSQMPPEVGLAPLRVAGATRETAFIGAGSIPGLQLKTISADGAREIPVNALPDRGDELLAFRAETGDWRVVLGVERQAPRVVAEVFNLITIGDGLVGGSATLRFGIVNQGVQQFRVRLPAHWRNLEFTGPNIRRKDRVDDVWTIALQDKAWGGYTLVITYDHAFDPHRATLDAAGVHPLEVERETGTVAITRAANLAIEPGPIVEPLRQVDPTELAVVDRSMISRPVLLAYRYEGGDYALALELTRHEESSVLDAVADRAEFTSVLTLSGEVLTQAGFMVKNNERPHQRVRLPAGATLWGVAVNGEPVRADRDGDWVVIALPRGGNRGETFAIEIKYAQQMGALGSLLPKRLTLVAPRTDVPGTYAEWVLYVPASRQVSGFGGTMAVAGGTTYSGRDGWERCCAFYAELWHAYGARLIVAGCVAGFVLAVILYGRKNGFGGVLSVIVVFGILTVLAGMLLPALSKAKSKAQRISSVNNLKQIGLSATIFAADNQGRMPASFEEMMNELSTEKILIDPQTGQRYTYVGAGKSKDDPHAIIAYSPERPGGGREVVFADGSVQQLNAASFAEALAKDQGGAANLQAQTMLQRYGAQPARPAPAQAAPPPMAATPQVAPEAATPTMSPTAAPTPIAAGVKSLQFDLPRAGRAYTFTRLLSVEDEPPTISVRIMSARFFVFARAVLQLSVFVAGLIWMMLAWRRAEAKPARIAAGAGLVLLATVDVLIAWRVLHLALIVAVPGLLAVIGAWIFWRWRAASGGDDAPTAPSGIPPQMALGLVLGLAQWGAAGSMGAAEAETNRVSIVSAELSGTTRERAAELQATFTLVSVVTNQSVTLFGDEVALGGFEVIEGEAQAWREGAVLGVRLGQAGTTRIRLGLLVKITDDAGRRQLDFALPPVLGGRLNLPVLEEDADVEFPGAHWMSRRASNGATLIESVFGGSDRLTVTWTPKRKRAADLAATVHAHQTAVVTLGAGTVNLRSAIEWRLTQGELQQVQVRLPEGHRLLRISGPHLRRWDLVGSDGSTLAIDLVRPVSPMLRLVIESEQALDQLPAEVPLRLPEVLDAMRQTGLVAVRATDDVGLTVQRAQGLERIDGADFVRASDDPGLTVLSAWRYLRPGFELQVKAEMLQPRIETSQHQRFTVGTDHVELDTELDYTIRQLGVFALRLALPAEGRLEAVRCAAMQAWSERIEGHQRVLELTLKERVLGSLRVEVRLHHSLSNLPALFPLAGIHPLGVGKQGGHVTVAAAPGVGLKTASLEGVVEVPASTVPGLEAGAAGVLAFKQLAAEDHSGAPWRSELATEQMESWLRAETLAFVSVGETLITGHTVIRYDVQNAPTREFRFQTPAAWRNVEMVGAGVRRRDRVDGEWRIELQNKVLGEYRLTVAWELDRVAGEDLILAGTEALGVERETGAVALLAPTHLQLTPVETSSQLLRIEARELPEWALAAAGGSPVLSYRSLQAGWQLRLGVKRFEDAAVLQGLVDQVRLRTVVADDGQQMTQLEATIRNSGRQSLELTLPPNARIWSAFADGQPVRPARRNGRLLLPLERSSSEDSPIPVEITYVGTMQFPRGSGRFELISPKLDLPLKDARWELFLPPDYLYSRFGGTMTYESAELVPITQDFTMAEYQRQELSRQDSFEARAADFLQRVRREMATGRFDNTTQLREYRQAPIRDQQAVEELEQLELYANRAQGQQLIDAQAAYAASNAARFGLDTETAAGQKSKATAEYDARMAEQQVAQLFKAQLVAENRVAPLRANLPTRGLRYSFIQALQTETDRPLTIRMRASNDTCTGWFTRLVQFGLGFLVLWIGAALALRLRPTRS
ncbi:MAG: hypothetical protein KJ072_02245 [Verrucomicrobia bacterium]|nr:hypothetical protein [Verrucomicrobiota bacterium]